MRIALPQEVKKIIRTLETAGYEAYAVGGCVRDSLLKREPEDWDITTSARPEQVKALFGRTVDTGIAHGTVTVLVNRRGYEVTTYRIDGEYRDHRHPEEVRFTDRLREDLRRRDFTINAMAYNETVGLVDAFDGIQDLQRGVIRCVGQARERFGEDALRILRAVRFAAQLGFTVEDETKQAARELAGSLSQISAERIQAELVKLLLSPHPQLLRLAWELGMTAVFLPEFDAMMRTEQNNPHHIYNVGEHTLKALECAKAERLIRLAVLCHDFGKPQAKTTVEGVDHFHGHPLISEQLAEAALRRLKFDHDTIKKVKILVRYHDTRLPLTKEMLPKLYCKERVVARKSVRRMVHLTGKELYPALLQVCSADVQAQSAYLQKEKLLLLGQMYEVYGEIIRDAECLSLRELAVGGRDLLAAGVAPGKQIGELLERMLDDVLDEPSHNTRAYLLEKYLQNAAK